MPDIKAIGFDLFNTLIVIEPDTLIHAMQRMLKSLKGCGFSIEDSSYIRDYKNAASIYVARARQDGIETHNSIWVSHVLNNYGIEILPYDERIKNAVDDYFSAFYDRVSLIPGTLETLAMLKKNYRLGLLSNFTHAPAAREILLRTGLAPCFDTILISGELGYRKPHQIVFEELSKGLGVEKKEIIFTGDDPEPDIHGASRAGLVPVWFTYIIDNEVPAIKGTIQSEITEPDIEVPRASSWQQFISLILD
ncbi:MAG: HAD family hydrolase [Deltaproteobacteria bacterium]|nr:HAD family hydrolase [Deltaproteobacteria bacterium]